MYKMETPGGRACGGVLLRQRPMYTELFNPWSVRGYVESELPQVSIFSSLRFSYRTLQIHPRNKRKHIEVVSEVL